MWKSRCRAGRFVVKVKDAVACGSVWCGAPGAGWPSGWWNGAATARRVSVSGVRGPSPPPQIPRPRSASKRSKSPAISLVFITFHTQDPNEQLDARIDRASYLTCTGLSDCSNRNTKHSSFQKRRWKGSERSRARLDADHIRSQHEMNTPSAHPTTSTKNRPIKFFIDSFSFSKSSCG